MKALRQFGFLKLGIGTAPATDQDIRVLALFRNRAELKKAYAELQEETFRLKDLIKQQEGATQRAQELMTTLESRLGATDTAYPALVFYQLRRLWQAGRELLTQFVADLVKQQEERERRTHLARHNRRLFAARQQAAEQLYAAHALHADATEHIDTLAAGRAALTRFWHYFKRHALERRIAAAQSVLVEANAAVTAAQSAVEEIARQPPPQFPGLSLPARRAINLAAIAYAQVLVLRLAELKAPLVQLARDATAKREAVDEYGPPRECVLLMGQIARAHLLLAERSGLAKLIHARAERLKAVARYRSATDSAPVADSLGPTEGDVLQQDAVAQRAQLPNVLADDVWDLFRVLVR